MSIVLISAALLLVAIVVAARGRSNRRKERRSGELEQDMEPLRDEIDEYWGSSLPSSPAGVPLWEAEPPAAEAKGRSGAQQSRPALDRMKASSPAEQAVGDRACRLGLAFLRSLSTQNHGLPGLESARAAGLFEQALNLLQRRNPTRVFGHGAVLQKLEAHRYLLFEPMDERVYGVDSVLGQIHATVGDVSTLTVVVGLGPDRDCAESSFLQSLVKHFNVPPQSLFMLEEDEMFYTHEELEKNYAPPCLELSCLPESFFDEILTYAQDELDAGRPEATLRTIGRMAGALWERSQRGEFDPLLLAQALNLLGSANRAVLCLDEAITCFDTALQMLKHVQDYESVQIVECNLGTTLLHYGKSHPEVLTKATKHLQFATQLDPEDVVAWHALGEVFTVRYDFERRSSLLGRAEHAYGRALGFGRDRETQSALLRIEKLKKLARSAEFPAVSASGALELAHENELSSELKSVEK